MDRGVWQATVHGVTKSWTWLSDLAYTHAQPCDTHCCIALLFLLGSFLCFFVPRGEIMCSLGHYES